jgi:anaerobic magnesium-protoporphyrin IX monomethyl ester cyclase
MKVCLIYPPQGEPSYPHPALPLLKAYCQAATGASVRVVDLNVTFYRWLASNDGLDHLQRRLMARVERLERNPPRSAQWTAELVLVYRALWAVPWLRDVITHTLTVLDGSAFDEAQYAESLQVLKRLFDVFNAAYVPHSLSFKDFSWHGGLDASRDLRSSVFAPEHPFRAFFETHVARLSGYDLYGVSIGWLPQLAPALFITHLLRHAFPTTPIVLGGSLIAHLLEPLQKSAGVFDDADFVIPSEGEYPLRDLIFGLSANNTPSDIDGLYTRTKKGWHAPERPVAAFDLSDMPTPDYSDLPLNQYLSPVRTLPLIASRGCYYGKCRFCDHFHHNARFRLRPADSVERDIRILHERHGTQGFYFVDDALPPRTIKYLARSLIARPLPVRFAAEVRFEPSLRPQLLQQAREAGFHTLIFGLESGNQRVLDLMRKGTTLAVMQRVLRDAHDAGIITWCFFMLGYPGEKVSELEATTRFLSDNRPAIDAIAGGPFIMTRNAPLRLRPDPAEHVHLDAQRVDLQMAFGWSQPDSPAQQMVPRLIDEARGRLQHFSTLPVFVEAHSLAMTQASYQHRFVPAPPKPAEALDPKARVTFAPDASEHPVPPLLRDFVRGTSPAQPDFLLFGAREGMLMPSDISLGDEATLRVGGVTVGELVARIAPNSKVDAAGVFGRVQRFVAAGILRSARADNGGAT